MGTFSNLRGTFETDEETGFPVLPQNFFWEVTKSSSYYSYLGIYFYRYTGDNMFGKPKFKRIFVGDRIFANSEFSFNLLLDEAFYLLNLYSYRFMDIQRGNPTNVSTNTSNNIKNYYGRYPKKGPVKP